MTGLGCGPCLCGRHDICLGETPGIECACDTPHSYEEALREIKRVDGFLREYSAEINRVRGERDEAMRLQSDTMAALLKARDALRRLGDAKPARARRGCFPRPPRIRRRRRAA